MGKFSKVLRKTAVSERPSSGCEYSGEFSSQLTDQKREEFGLLQAEEQAIPNAPWDERLVLATATTGAVAESIRTLRTRILYPVIGNTPRTLLITSASPGEGKSFICANLGISLAQGVDDYCILVDCDLRRPSQHQMFGVSNERGLVNHLQQKIAAEELIIKSGVDKLSILPAGPPPVNPAELSGSDSMIKLVHEMKERYDDRFVLLDSPPLHAAAETAVLAQHVDGVILVIRQGKSRREHVKALADTIGRDKIISVVFNAHQTNVLDTKIFGYQDYKAGYYYQEK
ncbi:CpsD/CapB family tyrosine-protein kinase [Desulfogranum marinum]|uniref:CpsD/CapB family tyrosine-protein kinase n=1 Tax=Desulfogranum marinum TaxID=453220 RepID=UPI0029C6B631|nr:CpsD/CapB family tyrosine-protein kinase [Desulfogranum marinum]